MMKHLTAILTACLLGSSLHAESYSVSPEPLRRQWEGWGVSLCWWAAQCGKWDDRKLDDIITWLVSPEGLNYNLFRYNIGGGEDPQWLHCSPHHMAFGKGLRAEMEGFKDSSDGPYHWERDSAQRRVMLKIKEKRPDAVFEAFSNSPPFYMTVSGCVAGHADGLKDNLRPECYEEFAHYLVDVCKHYKERYGIEFRTLEPFNESATGYWHQSGSQEGCHFDYASQVAFLRILAPILRQSGLQTVVSASDETSVMQSVEAFEAYRAAQVLPLVGQWNTHSYQATDSSRIRLASLTDKAGLPLWMSETGAGGKGIEGNLKLTRRLFDDIRDLRPTAWLDWQYMEERSDQWCTISGDFQAQTYRKVKNYFVRQQCSRFIKQGYDIIESGNRQALAAVSAARDTLVLVLLNEGEATTHDIDLRLFGKLPRRKQIKAFRTSESENMQDVSQSINPRQGTLSASLPGRSLTTIVVPLPGKAKERVRRKKN